MIAQTLGDVTRLATQCDVSSDTVKHLCSDEFSVESSNKEQKVKRGKSIREVRRFYSWFRMYFY